MKKLITGVLCLCGWTLFCQAQETDSIEFDAMHLEEIVVVDQWLHNHKPGHQPGSHQLELQLKQLQGVNLISRGSFAQQVMYRGQTDGRMQVKLNGMRIYSACTDKMDPSTSYVVSNNLRTAEMQSGCESHCSNNGLAGSLDLQLKTPSLGQEQKWKAGISQEFHSNTRGWVSNIDLENQAGKFAWRLNAAWQKHGNYQAGGGDEIAHSQNQKQNWALNTAYRLSDKELLRVDAIFDLATKVGYPALPMDVGRARAVIAGATYISHKKLGPFAGYELKLYHNDVYHEMDDTHRDDIYMHMDMPGWSQTTGASLSTYDWQVKNHRLNVAAEYYTNYRRAEMTMYPDGQPPMFMLTWPDTRIHGVGAGASDHWRFGKNMLTTTLRFDMESSHLPGTLGNRQWEGMGYNMETSRSYFLPQLKTSWAHNLTAAQCLSASAGYGLRAPTTSELFGFYLFNAHDAYDYLGNPDLKPESLLSAEIGYQYRKKSLSLETNIFLQQYYNYIFGLNSEWDAMTWGARGVRIYQNISNASFYGFEASASYRITSHLQAQAKTEFLRGVRNGNINLPLIPPLQGNLGATYQLKKFDLGVQGRLAAAQNHYNHEYGDIYTPAYALLDASVGYKSSIGKLQFEASITATNLLDSHYRDHLNWSGIPGMGRNVVMKITLSH